MESFGSFSDEEWESLTRMFSGDQDSGHCLFSSEQDHGLSFETPSIVSCLMTESNNANDSFHNDRGFGFTNQNVNLNFYHNFSQETCNNGCVAYDIANSLPYQSSNIVPFPTNGVCDEIINSSLLSQLFSDDSMEEILCLKQNVNIENSVDTSVKISNQLKHMPAKKRIKTPEDHLKGEKLNENPKKRTRVSNDIKNKKKMQPNKKQKMLNATENVKGVDEEETNDNKVGGNAPIASASSSSSDDDLNGGAINSNWKTRAGKGTATDPQSLYARKRRERINERLKILQNLVPNGTKVDISTMLEEAVQYVKFLQLQIKMLSSDEMWMYAPIAYNGMDMGLYHKLSRS